MPPGYLADGIGSRAAENGQGEHPGADDAKPEHQEHKLARNWA